MSTTVMNLLRKSSGLSGTERNAGFLHKLVFLGQRCLRVRARVPFRQSGCNLGKAWAKRSCKRDTERERETFLVHSHLVNILKGLLSFSVVAICMLDRFLSPLVNRFANFVSGFRLFRLVDLTDSNRKQSA